MLHKYGLCRFYYINKKGKSIKCKGEVHFPHDVKSDTIQLCNGCRKPHNYLDYDESELFDATTPHWLWKRMQSSIISNNDKAIAPTQETPNNNENIVFNRLNFVYFGAFVFLLTLFCYIFKWEIPLFESYSAAFLFSIILLTCAGFYYYIYEKKFFASFGILLFMGGIIGMWQIEPSDIFLLITSVGGYLLIIAFVPALLGVPLLFIGAYYLIASGYQAFRFGFNYITWYYWPLSIASILFGWLLIKRQEKLTSTQ